MLCTSCGADLETRSSKFCPHCGVPLQADDAPTATDTATAEPGDDLFALLFERKTPQLSQKPLPALLAAPPPRKDGGTPIEPFISSPPTADTVQDQREPTLTDETFPPVSLEMDDRIVVEPLYPDPSSVLFIREKIHPAIYGVAFAILAVFLSAFWWWGSEKTDPLQEDAGAPLPVLSSKPLRNAEPSRPLSAPASPTEGTLATTPTPEQELELMDIPSLPENQRQGRHNSAEIKDDQSLLPAYPPSSPSAQSAGVANTSAPEPAAADTGPPWLGQMRKDLSNCRNFYCLEEVRSRYCTRQWENLPECKDSSL